MVLCKFKRFETISVEIVSIQKQSILDEAFSGQSRLKPDLRSADNLFPMYFAEGRELVADSANPKRSFMNEQ